MNKNHLKIFTAGILSTVLLGVSTPAIALETPQTATQQDAPWGLDRIDQRTLPLDGKFTTDAEPGKGVSIYIVDNGFNSTHDDFTDRMDEGWSVIDGNDDTSPCNGHGTHVAGIAAGSTYGVAKSATIIPVKVADNNCGLTFESATAGLKWVKEHHQEGVPAVINISLSQEITAKNLWAATEMETEIQSLIDDGITVVAGAGNSIADACNFSPARTPKVITVAASNRDDVPWINENESGLGTNFGNCVDIYAPGQDTFSAGHTSNTATNTESGTSMASPYVAGAAAVILSRKPTLTPAQVAAEIRNTSTEGLLTGIPSERPNRLLFLSSTTSEPMPDVMAPWSPSNVVANLGDAVGEANIQWDQGDNGGSAITGQNIHIYEEGAGVYIEDRPAGDTSATISGLEQGKTYTFSVTATNAIGTGPESERSQPVTIPSDATAPDAPSIVGVDPVVAGAVIRYTQGADNGSPLTSQTINAYKDDLLVKSLDVFDTHPEVGTQTDIYMDGLEEGQTYTFSVAASNAIGTSPESAKSEPITTQRYSYTPSAPTNTRAAPVTTGGSANVYWEAASDNGSAITSYEITVYDGANVVKTVTVPGSYKGKYITGLYNGTYYHFTVKAINSVGISPESSATNAINPIAIAPGTATNVRAVAGDNNASIYWTRGSENGAPLTSQIVTVYSGTTKVGSATISGTNSSIRLTGLTEGRAVSFTITEVNKMGTGLESAKTDIVTPF